MRSQLKPAQDAVATQESEVGLAFERVPDDVEDEENEALDCDNDVDHDLLEEELNAGRTEPPHWEGLDDGPVQVEAAYGDNDAKAPARLEFLKGFIQSANLEFKDSDLTCFMCVLDITVSDTDRKRRWTANKLNRHLKGDFHSHSNMLLRAFKHDLEVQGVVTCKACPENKRPKFKNWKTFSKHLREKHRRLYDGPRLRPLTPPMSLEPEEGAGQPAGDPMFGVIEDDNHDDLYEAPP